MTIKTCITNLRKQGVKFAPETLKALTEKQKEYTDLAGMSSSTDVAAVSDVMAEIKKGREEIKEKLLALMPKKSMQGVQEEDQTTRLYGSVSEPTDEDLILGRTKAQFYPDRAQADAKAGDRPVLQLDVPSVILEDMVEEDGGYSLPRNVYGQAVPVNDEEVLANELPMMLRRQAESRQGGRGGPILTDSERQEVVDYVMKTLGPRVKTLFSETLGSSAEWNPTTETMSMLLGATVGHMDLAHHESMHAFFTFLRQNGSNDVLNLLESVAGNQMVQNRLKRLLAQDRPATRQLLDAEERVAYMYQFWLAGKLKLAAKPEGLFKRVLAFFRRMAGILSEEERAQAIMQAFHDGKFVSDPLVISDIMQRGRLAEKMADKMAPLFEKMGEYIFTADSILRDTNNPALEAVADLFHRGATSTKPGLGYLNAKAQQLNVWLSRLDKIFEGLDDVGRDALHEAAKRQRRPTAMAERAKYDQLTTFMKEFHDYLTNSGMRIGKIDNYAMPRVWNWEMIDANAEEFRQELLDNHRDVLLDMSQAHNEEAREKAVKEWLTANNVASVQHIPADKVDSYRELQDRYDDFVPSAENIADMLLARMRVNPVEALAENESRVGYHPYMQSANKRSLNFLNMDVFGKYLEEDMVRVLSRYVMQGVKRAEYERTFGMGGSELTRLLSNADEWFRREGWSNQERERVMERAHRAVMSMEGTIGNNGMVAGNDPTSRTMEPRRFSPGLQKAMGWIMTYQNLRILPLALFSSIVDPMGIIVRGGEVRDALAAFKRGTQEIMASIKGEALRDEALKLAEEMGTVDSVMFMDALGEMYSSVWMTGAARKINDRLFRLNGLEQWNRGIRIGATVAAERAIMRMKQNPDEHSERHLAELGLTSDDVVIRDGRLKVQLLEGERNDIAETLRVTKVRQAVSRWVDGAVLRPNQSQRPMYGSDPRTALFFHMKQFVYSFQNTILKQVAHEWEQGNLSPALALAGYVPVMIAIDIIKELALGFGEEPKWKRGWTVSDYVTSGIERAGLLGVGQLMLDTQQFGPEALLGPAVDQAVDAFRQPLDRTMINALPISPVLKRTIFE